MSTADDLLRVLAKQLEAALGTLRLLLEEREDREPAPTVPETMGQPDGDA